MLRNDTWAHFEYMSAFVSTKLPNNRKSNQLMSSFLPFAVSTIARLRLDALEKQTVTPRSFSSRTLKTVPRNEKVWLRHLTTALVYTELHNIGSAIAFRAYPLTPRLWSDKSCARKGRDLDTATLIGKRQVWLISISGVVFFFWGGVVP